MSCNNVLLKRLILHSGEQDDYLGIKKYPCDWIQLQYYIIVIWNLIFKFFFYNHSGWCSYFLCWLAGSEHAYFAINWSHDHDSLILYNCIIKCYPHKEWLFGPGLHKNNGSTCFTVTLNPSLVLYNYAVMTRSGIIVVQRMTILTFK